MRDVNQWIETLGLGQYAEIFAANDIDMEVLPELTEGDLEKLGMSMGHRKKLLRAIMALAVPDQSVLPEAVPPATLPDPVTLAPLEGERRQATVMFADLSGYTAMNETLDPEEVEALMSRIKAEAVRIVERYGGIVNQFVGDEVLALFGIPTAHEDDPVRAVGAALELHTLVRRMSAEVESRIGQPLRFHTGINTGLIVTNLRDQRDGTYGITGDTVNTGARLKAQAAADTILVSPDTQRWITDFFQTEALEAVPLKGKDQAMTPYRIAGKTRVASRFEAAAQRGFTRYAGREHELATLHSCLERVIAGQGQFLTVVGEAGVGKSRLLFEFRHSVDRSKITVLQGRCQSYGTMTPYLPFRNALRQGLQLRDEDTPEQLLVKAVSNIRAIDPALEPYIPLSLHLLSMQSAAYPLPTDLQGEKLRTALAEALAAIITLHTQHQPLVLILEDWQWADEASDATLRHLIGLMAPYPVLLVLLYRPEYAGAWGNLSYHSHLVLPPLEADNTARIIKAVLRAERLPTGLASMVHKHTGGNPFFIEEVCRSLTEEGIIQVEDRQAILTRSFEHLTLPETVQAVIRARLDRLDRDTKEALRLAAVIGREFAHRILEHIHTVKARLSDALEDLTTLELIQQIRILPEAVYMFKHMTTQQVTYDTLRLHQRKTLHGIVGQAIEALYADRLDEQVETLAYHYHNSADTAKALHYLERAGDKAAGYYALDDAKHQYREALAVLDAMEMTPDRQQHRIDLSLKWAKLVSFEPSEHDIPGLHTSLAHAQDLQDQSRMAYTTFWIGRIQYYLGNMPEAQRHFQQCLEWAEVLHDEEFLVLPYNTLGRSFILDNDFTKCVAYLEQGIPMAERLGNQDEFILSSFYLGLSSAWIGDFAKAFANVEQAIAVARATGNLFLLAWSQYAMGYVKLLRGDWVDTMQHLNESLQIATRISAHAPAAAVSAMQGYVTFMLGERKPGIALMEEGIAHIESTDHRFLLTLLLGWLAEIYALAGSHTDATRCGNKALECMKEGLHYGELITHRALAMAAGLASPPDWRQVESHLKEAIHLAEAKEAHQALALAYFRYAELLRAKGNLEQVTGVLNQATALFTAMEMSWWREQAEQLRESLAVR